MSIHPAWVEQLSPDVRKWAKGRRRRLSAYAPTPNLKPPRPRQESEEKWLQRVLRRFRDPEQVGRIGARVQRHYLAGTTGTCGHCHC